MLVARALLCAFVLLVLGGQSAHSQVRSVADFGEAMIAPDGTGSVTLHLDQVAYRLPGSPASAEILDQTGEYLLVRLGHPQSNCPYRFIWIHAVNGMVRMTPSFGTCSSWYLLIKEQHRALVYTKAAQDPEQIGGEPAKLSGFSYNGRSLKRISGTQPSKRRGAHLSRNEWLGKYPNDLLRAPGWLPQIAGQLDQADIQLLRQSVNVSAPFRLEGDWLVGRGCSKRHCKGERAVIAIHVTNGQMVFGMLDRARKFQLIGSASNSLPKGLFDFLDIKLPAHSAKFVLAAG